MMVAELSPLELAGRLALALGLAVFVGLAFEEIYKREDRSAPGGVRTFPMLALSGAMLYLIEPRQALAFIAGLGEAARQTELNVSSWDICDIHRCPLYGRFRGLCGH
jgi:hypothetical protein